MTDRYRDNSVRDFVSYHDYATGSNGVPYAVITYDQTGGGPREMTIDASHELAEAVTDPAPTDKKLGWYDENYGEVTDIVDELYDAGRLGDEDVVDELRGPDGTVYSLEIFWRLRDTTPVGVSHKVPVFLGPRRGKVWAGRPRWHERDLRNMQTRAGRRAPSQAHGTPGPAADNPGRPRRL